MTDLETTAMFPLGTPLLPGALLSLHVFEPRYRQMIQDLLADDTRHPQFGVVMIERGHEVGGGDQRARVATNGRVLDIRALPEGRYALSVAGTHRLRVVEWLPDDPYPRARVEPWPEPDLGADAPALAERVEALHERAKQLNAAVRELGRRTAPDDTKVSEDPRLACYHVAALAPIGPVDRYRVLAAPGLAERVDVLGAALDDVAAVIQFRRS